MEENTEITEISSRESPSAWKLKIGISANGVATSLGMVSLGLLAMLITHHDLKERDSSPALIIVADTISFFTAILGKIAIVLFFNQPIFVRRFRQIYNNGFSDIFKIQKKSFLEYIGWGLNYILSLNASLFWAGLVQVSFKKSADILDELGSDTAHSAAIQIRQWSVFIIFVLCSFYANWIAWPSIHQSGYQQMKGLLKWSLEARSYRRLKETLGFHVNTVHDKLMKELKKCFKKDNLIETSHLNALLSVLDKKVVENENELCPLPKVNWVVDKVKNSPRLLLRKAYLESNPVPPKIPTFFEWIRRGVAVVFTIASIWGFHNVIGLTDVIWSQWGMSAVSTYGGRYAAYFSMMLVVQSTVYPLIYQLTGMVKYGTPSHVFSKSTLIFILSITIFVAIFGGLANGEQSALDNESVNDIILSSLASSLVDAFCLFMVLCGFFEQRIIESKKTDDETRLKQGYLALQTLGREACKIDEVGETDLHNLSKKGNNIQDNTPDNDNDTGTEQQKLLNKNRMFCCFESRLRSLFNVENDNKVSSYP